MSEIYKQREKAGVTAAQLATALGKDPEGVKCSGGQIENFRAGWAKAIMNSSRVAHHFTRSKTDISQAVSLCGMKAEARWLYGAGNFDYCRNCKRKGIR